MKVTLNSDARKEICSSKCIASMVGVAAEIEN